MIYSRTPISLPSIHKLGLGLTRTDLPIRDRQVVNIRPSTASVLPTNLPILVLPPPTQTSLRVSDSTLQTGLQSTNHSLDSHRSWLPTGASIRPPPAIHLDSLPTESTTVPTPASSIASPILWKGPVDSPHQHEPDLANHRAENFARKGCRSQRTSPPFGHSKSDDIIPRGLRTKPADSKAKKKADRRSKTMEEQKRRRNESYLQRRMQDFLLFRGHKFTEPLSEQNAKVSGLKFNKLEIMEEFLYEVEELENPYAALVRHVARWRKFRVQIPRAEELVKLLTVMPELSDGCGRDMEWARLLAEEMQKLLPSRHLNIVGIDMVTPEKEWKEQLRQLSPGELQQRLTDLAGMLGGELERWRAGKKRLTRRIWALKRKIVIIENRKLNSAYSPSTLRSFHWNKRFPTIFLLDDLKFFTPKRSRNGNRLFKSRL